MRPLTVLLPVAAASLAAAPIGAPCTAQTPTPAPAPGTTVERRGDTTITERRSADGRVVERDVVIRRGGADGPDAPRPPRAPYWIGPAGREFARIAEERRSVIGVLLGEADTLGLRVAGVSDGGPAARAGVTTEDRLVAVNGTSLRLAAGDAGDPILAQVPARRLERTVGALAPGQSVRLTVQRGRAQRTVSLTTVAPSAVAGASAPRARVEAFRGMDRLPDDVRQRLERLGTDLPRALSPERRADMERRFQGMRDSARARAERLAALGVSVEPTGSARDTLGLLVTRVVPGGPAERAGLTEGDRVAAVNGVDVRVPRDAAQDRAGGPDARARATRFTREVQRARPGDEVAPRLWSDGRWRDVRVRAGRQADVYPNQNLLGLGEGGMRWYAGPEGADVFVAPRLAPMAPMPPMPPMAPMAPLAPTPPVPPDAPDGDAPMRFRLERGPDVMRLQIPRTPRAPRVVVPGGVMLRGRRLVDV